MEGKSQNVCPERANSCDNIFRIDGNSPIGIGVAALRGVETRRMLALGSPTAFALGRANGFDPDRRGGIRIVSVASSEKVCLRAYESLVIP